MPKTETDIYSDEAKTAGAARWMAAEAAYDRQFAGDQRMLADHASRYFFIRGYMLG